MPFKQRGTQAERRPIKLNVPQMDLKSLNRGLNVIQLKLISLTIEGVVCSACVPRF